MAPLSWNFTHASTASRDLTKDNNSPLLPRCAAGHGSAFQRERYSLQSHPTGHPGKKKHLVMLRSTARDHCHTGLLQRPSKQSQHLQMEEKRKPRHTAASEERQDAAGLRLHHQHGHFSNLSAPSSKTEAKHSSRCLRQAWHSRIVSSQHKACISGELFSSHWFIHSWKVEEETQPSSQQKHRESTLNKWSILCIPCTYILCSQQYYFLTFSWIKPPHFFFSFLRIFILLYFVAVLLPSHAQILLVLAVLCTMLCYTENYLTSHIFLISQWKKILATRK